MKENTMSREEFKRRSKEIAKLLESQKNDKETWIGEIHKPIKFQWQMSRDCRKFTTWGNHKTGKLEEFIVEILKVSIKALYPIVRKVKEYAKR